MGGDSDGGNNIGRVRAVIDSCCNNFVEFKLISVNTRGFVSEITKEFVSYSTEAIVKCEDSWLSNLGICSTITSNIYIETRVISFYNKVW